MTRLAKILIALGGVTVILIVIWVAARTMTDGLPNVFLREQVIADTRPLSEDMAIEISRKALQAAGYDVAGLRPLPLGNDSKILFEQNSETEGAMSWIPLSGGLSVRVRMTKQSDGIHCRIYKQK